MVKLSNSASKNKKSRPTRPGLPARGRPARRQSAQPAGVASKTRVLAKPPMLPMYCRCLADPEGSQPCRLPDDYVSPTNAIKLVEEFTVTTDNSGFSAFTISPAVARSKYVTPLTTTAGVTASGTDTYTAQPDFATLSAQFVQGRTVALQVTVNYIGAPMSAAGRLIWIESDNVGYISNATDISAFFDDGESSPLIEGKIIRSRPTQAPRFEPIAGGGFGLTTWPVNTFIIVGAPTTTTVVSVRVTRHIEAIPVKTSIMRGEARPEPYNPDALAMAANMGVTGKSGTTKQDSALKRAAMGAAEVAWAGLGPQVSTAVTKYGAGAATWASEALMALML